MNKIRVLLVDDHEIVHLGLMTLTDDQPDLEVVGETDSASWHSNWLYLIQ